MTQPEPLALARAPLDRPAQERWDRWVAKGAEHDRRMSVRMRAVTALLFTALLVALTVVITTR